ncbi:MAG: hypothetical protein U0802_19430 [Candidatus Binatia bacterium]
MTLEELQEAVILCDGQVQSIRVRPMSSEVDVVLVVRPRAFPDGPSGVVVDLTFSGAVEHSFNDDNMDDTQGYYSDITFCRRADGRYYLSLDPFGNSCEPHDKDNDIVVADVVTIALANKPYLDSSTQDVNRD